MKTDVMQALMLSACLLEDRKETLPNLFNVIYDDYKKIQKQNRRLRNKN